MDSTFANFDPRLRAGSAAIGMGSLGSDVGALAFAVSGPDLTPPSAVTDLATSMVSDQNLALAWTAPGDDGTTGMASAYDLRESTSPITDVNFGAATAVPLSAPGGAGSSQATVITGLTPGTTYYFALKVRDEAGNWSVLGNVLAVQMKVSDQVAPKSIPDLSGGP
jgi:chitodextrinase